jgi:hypothetical protein
VATNAGIVQGSAMTIPTFEDFIEYRDFMRKHRPTSTHVSVGSADSVPIFKSIQEFSNHFIFERNALLKASQELNAHKWLASQPYYLTARKKASKPFNKKKSNPNHPAFANEAEWMTFRLQEITNEPEKHRSLEAYLRNWLDALWRINDWSEHICSSLNEYFHGEPPIETSKKGKKISDLRAGIVKSLEEHRRQIEEAILKSTDFWDYNPIHPRETENIDRAIRQLTRRAFLPDELSHPIDRNDARAKEKLLIYRLWRYNRRNKTFSCAVTCDLLYLEGIEHQYDERSIERLYAKYADNFNAWKANFLPG